MNGPMYIPMSASTLSTAAELARQCSATAVRERVFALAGCRAGCPGILTPDRRHTNRLWPLCDPEVRRAARYL